MDTDLLSLTADIVAAHVSNNSIEASEIPALISSVYGSLTATTVKSEPKSELVPAVEIKKSVKPDYIVCLEDGAKLKMLKRYLKSRYDLTPEQYRAKWNLPRDYPMVAPNYAETRRALAKSIGLGRKSEPTAAAPAESKPVAPIAAKTPPRRAAAAKTPKAAAKTAAVDATAKRGRGRPRKTA